MKRKYKRLSFVILGVGLVAGATALMLNAFQNNIVFFHTPTEIVEKDLGHGHRIRVGGLVEKGSVKHDGTTVHFRVTDLVNSIPVTYTGVLPDLFREGQGVVAEGTLKGGQFRADEVLAKHDEKYMPPEVADALKKSGKWEELKEKMEHPQQLQQAGEVKPAAAGKAPQ